MVALANTTTASDLIDPVVWADYIAAQLPHNIHLRPLAQVNTQLQGTAGSTITVPSYSYMGDAVPLAELADVPLRKLGVNTQEVPVAKIANGFALSDEAILNSGGAPETEGTRQLVASFGQTVDKDLYNKALAGAGHKVTTEFTIDKLLAELANFGEWSPEQFAAIVVSPAKYGVILGDSRIQNASTTSEASSLITGSAPRLFGIPVLMASRATAGALVVKKNALGLAIKRDVLVEKDRDTVNFSTVITGSMHYAAYVQKAADVLAFAADGDVTP